jgi:hypothetical protein
MAMLIEGKCCYAPQSAAAIYCSLNLQMLIQQSPTALRAPFQLLKWLVSWS